MSRFILTKTFIRKTIMQQSNPKSIDNVVPFKDQVPTVRTPGMKELLEEIELMKIRVDGLSGQVNELNKLLTESSDKPKRITKSQELISLLMLYVEQINEYYVSRRSKTGSRKRTLAALAVIRGHSGDLYRDTGRMTRNIYTVDDKQVLQTIQSNCNKILKQNKEVVTTGSLQPRELLLRIINCIDKVL